MKPGSKYHHLIHSVKRLELGQVYAATKGIEFLCEPDSFRGVVYELATTKGGGWRGTCTVIGRTVYYAFYKDTDYMRPNLPACPVVRKARGN